MRDGVPSRPSVSSSIIMREPIPSPWYPRPRTRHKSFIRDQFHGDRRGEEGRSRFPRRSTSFLGIVPRQLRRTSMEFIRETRVPVPAWLEEAYRHLGKIDRSCLTHFFYATQSRGRVQRRSNRSNMEKDEAPRGNVLSQLLFPRFIWLTSLILILRKITIVQLIQKSFYSWKDSREIASSDISDNNSPLKKLSWDVPSDYQENRIY